MRIIWLGLFLLMASSVYAQGQGGGNNNNANQGGAAAIAGAGGGGTGGRSENLEATFGQRSSVNSSEGFLGSNLNAQAGAFVGQNQAAIAGGQFGNLGGVQAGGRGGANAGGNRGGQQPQQQQQNRQIRVRLVLPNDVAQEYRVIPAAKLQNTLSTQFRQINETQARSKAGSRSQLFRNSNINVTANGRTVTLRGQVRSNRERRLAERIAKFEPGVDRVQNQLTVSP